MLVMKVQIEEMPPVRQKLRKKVTRLKAYRLGNRHCGRRATLRGHTVQSIIETKENDTLAAPCPSVIVWRVAQDQRGPSMCVDFLQLPLREESDELSIRRPERVVSPLRP